MIQLKSDTVKANFNCDIRITGAMSVAYHLINMCFIFAGLTVIPALVGLFTWNQRNPTAVVEGLQQFYFFSLATFLAFVFTVLVSHLIQKSKLPGNEVRYDGLEALKKATFFQALQHKFSRKR